MYALVVALNILSCFLAPAPDLENERVAISIHEATKSDCPFEFTVRMEEEKAYSKFKLRVTGREGRVVSEKVLPSRK